LTNDNRKLTSIISCNNLGYKCAYSGAEMQRLYETVLRLNQTTHLILQKRAGNNALIAEFFV
jgi:hypothetical protein